MPRKLFGPMHLMDLGIDPVAFAHAEDNGWVVWACTLGCKGGHVSPVDTYSGVCGSCGMTTARPIREFITKPTKYVPA